MTYDASPQPRFCFLGCRGRIEKRHNCRQVAPVRCVAPSTGAAVAATAPALKAAAGSAVRPTSVARVLAAPCKAVSSGTSQAIGGRALLSSHTASSSLPRAGRGTPYPALAVTLSEPPRRPLPSFMATTLMGARCAARCQWWRRRGRGAVWRPQFWRLPSLCLSGGGWGRSRSTCMDADTERTRGGAGGGRGGQERAGRTGVVAEVPQGERADCGDVLMMVGKPTAVALRPPCSGRMFGCACVISD